jgi:aspartyl/asparaginyl beta-hydroxylase (cupin superfamily)
MSTFTGNEVDTDIRPWYSFKGQPFDGPFPAFFDEAEWTWLLSWQKDHAEIFSALREEIENFLRTQGQSLQPYFNTRLVEGQGQWKVGNFMFWGERNEKNFTHCPKLDAWLKNLPGMRVLSAAVSVLPPHTEIKPHIGDTSTVARCHLGLSIPASLPDCGIQVNGESRSWNEGEWLIFCDAFEHSAWNRTSEPRYVLIIDILLPQYEEYERDICRNVRSLLKLQALTERRPWVAKLPGKLRGLIRRFYKFTL